MTKNRYLIILICLFSIVNYGPLAKAGQDYGSAPACVAASSQLEAFAGSDEAKAKLINVFKQYLSGLKKPEWSVSYCKAVSENLTSKKTSVAEGVSFTAENLERTTLQYEEFRLDVFDSSAVSPKRFFGYLDNQGKSAKQERQLVDVSVRIAKILNDFAEQSGSTVRVTPKEIIVTHLAEGGAKLLTSDYQNVESVHPVYGFGLDDFLIGFNYFPGLLPLVDAKFGTRLGSFANDRNHTMLMTFEESVLGTAVMYFYEKVLADNKRRDAGLPPTSSLSLDEQYIVASLVYNSGILFAEDRVAMIRSFQTADYLYDVSEKTAQRTVNARPRLPIGSKQANDALLLAQGALPQQPTSWNAVYHILQRYGAWVALSRFSNYFDPNGYPVK